MRWVYEPFKPIASTNHTRSQYRGIHTNGMETLTRRCSIKSVMLLREESYTVTSLEVSNWRLLFTPAILMIYETEAIESEVICSFGDGGDVWKKNFKWR
jgi:hypothetical protein